MSNTTDLAWRGATVALVALTLAAASGCGRRHTVVVRDQGLAQRYQQQLIRLAARDTGCPAGQLTPMQIGQDPGVYSVTGCAFPIEYWLQCGRRGRCQWQRVATLNEQAASALGCAPQMVQQQFTQSPNVRVASGCGRQATFQVGCNGAACGWALAGGVQGAGPPPTQGGTPVEPTTQPGPPAGEATAALQAQLQQHREAIMSCIDQPVVYLTVRWTAQGFVQVGLPPELTGSAAEGCIQAALGTLRIAASQAGQVTVPVQ